MFFIAVCPKPWGKFFLKGSPLCVLCRAFLKRQFVFRSELGLGLYGEFGGSRGWWVGVGVGTGVVEPRA